MEGRGLTILELRIVVIWERTPKKDKFRYCPQGGDTSLFTQDFLGSGDLFLHLVLASHPMEEGNREAMSPVSHYPLPLVAHQLILARVPGLLLA